MKKSPRSSAVERARNKGRVAGSIPAVATINRAERAVNRAAMGIVNERGWAFTSEQPDNTPVVLFPGAMRRLETAIAKLKQARKEAKPRKRK
jgi:hypothetical protein